MRSDSDSAEAPSSELGTCHTWMIVGTSRYHNVFESQGIRISNDRYSRNNLVSAEVPSSELGTCHTKVVFVASKHISQNGPGSIFMNQSAIDRLTRCIGAKRVLYSSKPVIQVSKKSNFHKIEAIQAIKALRVSTVPDNAPHP